jgi:hypothetical protein
VDSDLADAVEGLKAILARRKLDGTFGKAPPELVDSLKKQLRVPSRYRAFLLAANPVHVETVTPVERIRLIPADELVKAQTVVTTPTDGATLPLDWKPAWVIVGESSLLGDPYFLDTSKPDAEGDCPVYTAMSGTDTWQPKLCASTFALFLRILAVGMDVAKGFAIDDYDVDNEQVFREALGPKIREYDPAAVKAGHWT